ncbi:efflux RND transporter periplasmic adaptor subunit [Cylindrospermum stagnale]|uniref:efflux RND transporter periplasmic adaptor subunit n=1 Tax=Cylindrospermum stagnale TaxID=142864 RepID=UPI000318FA10
MVAPISGIVAERAVTLGETVTVDSDSKPLMTILDDSRVLATANVYEKDLKKIKVGQSVRVTVTSLPNQSFSGRIAVIGAVVGEARVVAVKAELENSRNSALLVRHYSPGFCCLGGCWLWMGFGWEEGV